jgi:hypothetical protein
MQKFSWRTMIIFVMVLFLGVILLGLGTAVSKLKTAFRIPWLQSIYANVVCADLNLLDGVGANLRIGASFS